MRATEAVRNTHFFELHKKHIYVFTNTFKWMRSSFHTRGKWHAKNFFSQFFFLPHIDFFSFSFSFFALLALIFFLYHTKNHTVRFTDFCVIKYIRKMYHHGCMIAKKNQQLTLIDGVFSMEREIIGLARFLPQFRIIMWKFSFCFISQTWSSKKMFLGVHNKVDF